MLKKLLFLIPLTFILIGCTVTQNLTMTSAEKGSAQAEIQVDPFFITLLEDFSTIAPQTTQYGLMEEAMISFANRVASSQFSDSVGLRADETGRNFFLSFSYSDLMKLIADLEERRTNTVLRAEGNTLSFSLSMDNYHELKEAIPFLTDPNFEVYGPEYNNGMTEEEYSEMIWFLLGDEGPEALAKGSVSLSIRLPGEVVEAKGVKTVDSTSVVFSFPIIDFLLLNTPLEFSVTWK